MNEWVNKLMNDQSMAKEIKMNIRISFYSNHDYRLTLELNQNINQVVFFFKTGESGLH